MSEFDRRTFLTTVSMAGLTSLAPTGAAAPAVQDESTAPPATTPTDVTRTLARYVLSVGYDDLPEPVRKEARRTLLNWVGCAVGGSRHETVDVAIAALAPFSGPAQATRARPSRAAGHSACGADERHQLARVRLRRHASEDRDPSGRTGRVGAPRARRTSPDVGPRLPHAMVLGIEAECRIGNAVYPAHYDRGWHITGTAGVFGAAAACGRSSGIERAADGVGTRPRGDAAGGAARDVRDDDQELSSRTRRAERADGGAPRVARLHQHRGRRSRARAAGPTC